MESQTKVDALNEWFKANGGQGQIYPKEAFCKCPFNLTLSYLNVHVATEPTVSPESTRKRATEYSSVCSSLLNNQTITQRTIGIFFLAEQRLKGAKSFWAPYIQLLPTESTMTTPLWFKDAEMAYLRGTNLLSNDTPFEKTSVGLQLESYRTQWKLRVGEIETCGESARDFTWELFLWAAIIFSSRGFTSDLLSASNLLDSTDNSPENPKPGSDALESEPSSSYPLLYPVFDIFNHRPGAKVGWDMGQTSDFGLIHLDDDKIEPGQQVFNNYSDKGNEDLLMGFGFCIPNNPHDRVALRLGQVSPQTHSRLRQALPTHWTSSTWNTRESVFYLSASGGPSSPQPRSDITTPCTSSSSSRIGVMPRETNLRHFHGDSSNTTSTVPPELVQSVYVIMQEHYEAAEAAAAAANLAVPPTLDGASDEAAPPPPEQQKQQIIWLATIGLLREQMENTLGGITRWDEENNNSDERKEEEEQESVTSEAKAALVYRAGQISILRAGIEELRGLRVDSVS